MIIAKVDAFPLRIPVKRGSTADAAAWGDLTAGAVDFVQPRPAKMGGISELAKVFPIAAVHDVAVMIHSFYDGPGLLAAIHVAAALGTADAMIEWRHFNLEAQLYGGALSPGHGRISVPQGPGLGIEPDQNVIRTYLRV